MHIEYFYNIINYDKFYGYIKNNYYLKEKVSIDSFIKKYNYNGVNEIKKYLFNNFSNCNTFFKFSYSISNLKQLLKLNKQKIIGKKFDLYKRLYLFMYLSYACVYIQQNYRNMLCRRLNTLHGPARINRNLCINDTDFFTLDNINDIDYNNFYSYQDENNFIYGFNIISIYNLLKKNKLKNPYTLNEMNISIYDNIKEFIKISKLLNINIDIELCELENIDYEKRLLNIFQEIDLLGNYTNIEWFNELSLRRKICFLRELYDIWTYRANLTFNIKLEIYPYGDPFLNLNLNNLHNNIPINNFNNICLNIIENFILYGIDRNSKSLGALYVLSALTIVSPSAANALPWLHQSVNHE